MFIGIFCALGYLFVGSMFVVRMWWHRHTDGDAGFIAVCLFLWPVCIVIGICLLLSEATSGIRKKLNNFRDIHNPRKDDPRWK